MLKQVVIIYLQMTVKGKQSEEISLGVNLKVIYKSPINSVVVMTMPQQCLQCYIHHLFCIKASVVPFLFHWL